MCICHKQRHSFNRIYKYQRSKCTIHPRTPIKRKIGGKILSQTCQNKLLSPLFNSVKFSLRLKIEWVVLVAFKLSVVLNA